MAASRICRIVMSAALLLASAAVPSPGAVPPGDEVAGTAEPSAGAEPGFVDVTKSAGVGHRHHGPAVDARLQNLGPWFTALGAGGAVGDFNNDGYDDIYVTDSARGYPNALYRNNGDMTFTDVAAQAGVALVNDEKNFSTMALFFDCDNDGYKDLLVVRFGQSKLFHNKGDGTFEDISAQSEFPINRNAVAAIAFDYDRDGLLDLYFGSYFPDVDLTNVKTTKLLHDSWETARNGGTNYLMKNVGGCKFVDRTKEAGVGDTGWTLAVASGDIDKDGWPDIYIANDFGADVVYRNNGNGTFTDVSQKAIGIDTKKSMDAEFGDYDNDGWLDIYVTNITEQFLHECNALWRNNHDFTFTDVSVPTGTCNTGWGWGGKFLDYDNDGWLDLYVADGFISAGKEDYIDILMPIMLDSDVDLSDTMSWPALGGRSFSGYEAKKMFHNNGHHGFVEVAERLGVAAKTDGRGVLIGDFDNDGAEDIYLLNSNQDAVMYRNLVGRNNRWMEIRLQGTKSNRDGIGTKVTFFTPQGLMYRETNAGNGFEGQSSSYVHVGTGKLEKIDRVLVQWPSGTTQEFKDLPTSQRYFLVEGNPIEPLVLHAPKFTARTAKSVAAK